MRLFPAFLLVASTGLCFGIVTKPVDDISAIRLSQKKRQAPHRAAQMSMQRALQGDDLRADETEISQASSQLSVKLNITEPFNGAIVVGPFSVKIDIIASDQDAFLSKYNTTDSKICVTLNKAQPYFCYPALSGRIFFTGAEDGDATLTAMLYGNGKLDRESKTTSTFTVVKDPKLAEDATDKANEGNNIQNAGQGEESSTQVQVEYPRVDVSSPLDLVTYPGHSVSLRFGLEPKDMASFQHYFAHAFVCVCIDQAPAFSCFAIFGDEGYSSPLVLNLPNGKHTIEAALSHPETGELMESSKSSTSTFFTAGELLEAANIVVDVTVAGERHVVPLMEGTNLEAQTSAFCGSVGMVETKTCEERIRHKLWSAWENMLQSL